MSESQGPLKSRPPTEQAAIFEVAWQEAYLAKAGLAAKTHVTKRYARAQRRKFCRTKHEGRQVGPDGPCESEERLARDDDRVDLEV